LYHRDVDSGDRIAETHNSVRTEFTLDVASSLTQVLAETNTSSGKTITYLYGLGLVGQSSAGMTEYHLTDALGSIRQLTGSV
jgi:hypothetical protein